jgi:hypothetical protein
MRINKLSLPFIGLFLFFVRGSITHVQASGLSLSSALVNPGGTATLGVALTVSGTTPAGLEWTFIYSPSQISAISITPGPEWTVLRMPAAISVPAGQADKTGAISILRSNPRKVAPFLLPGTNFLLAFFELVLVLLVLLPSFWCVIALDDSHPVSLEIEREKGQKPAITFN